DLRNGNERRAPDGPEAFRADVREVVLWRMPPGARRRAGAVVEVDQVERRNPGPLERGLVVEDRSGRSFEQSLRARGVAEEQVEGAARGALAWDSKVAVADH